MARWATGVALALTLLALSLGAEAQQTMRGPRIGVVTMVSAHTPRTEAFRKGLTERGYVEGQNVAIDWKWAAGSLARLPQLVSELLDARVDVIVAGGPQPIAVAKRLTSTTPIVMVGAADPVGAGFVKTLARPGGNLTGLSIDATPELFQKQVDLIKEAIPRVTRIAVIWNSAVPGAAAFLDRLRQAAQVLKLELYWVDVQGRDEFEKFFAVMSRERAGAVLVVTDPFIYVHRARVVGLAARYRIPAMYL
ncbi:MAG: hypothetical protein FJZ38_13655 [Candidatus Rokubacteria bacterium]|nr:hypothetical protein [Candidatus Rokubacteria bacterium]